MHGQWKTFNALLEFTRLEHIGFLHTVFVCMGFGDFLFMFMANVVCTCLSIYVRMYNMYSSDYCIYTGVEEC